MSLNRRLNPTKFLLVSNGAPGTVHCVVVLRDMDVRHSDNMLPRRNAATADVSFKNIIRQRACTLRRLLEVRSLIFQCTCCGLSDQSAD